MHSEGITKKAEDVALVVGNGWGNDSYEYRSDALTLDYSGNLKLAGNLTANSPGWDYLGAEIHGAVRFGNNWTSDSTSILLAVGNGADSKNLRDALTLDSDGNLHISGKFTAGGGCRLCASLCNCRHARWGDDWR